MKCKIRRKSQYSGYFGIEPKPYEFRCDSKLKMCRHCYFSTYDDENTSNTDQFIATPGRPPANVFVKRLIYVCRVYYLEEGGFHCLTDFVYSGVAISSGGRGE